MKKEIESITLPKGVVFKSQWWIFNKFYELVIEKAPIKLSGSLFMTAGLDNYIEFRGKIDDSEEYSHGKIIEQEIINHIIENKEKICHIFDMGKIDYCVVMEIERRLVIAIKMNKEGGEQ